MGLCKILWLYFYKTTQRISSKVDSNLVIGPYWVKTKKTIDIIKHIGGANVNAEIKPRSLQADIHTLVAAIKKNV